MDFCSSVSNCIQFFIMKLVRMKKSNSQIPVTGLETSLQGLWGQAGCWGVLPDFMHCREGTASAVLELVRRQTQVAARYKSSHQSVILTTKPLRSTLAAKNQQGTLCKLSCPAPHWAALSSPRFPYDCVY